MKSSIAPLRVLTEARDSFARPLTDLRMSVLDRCNFRCPYCMPAEHFPEGHRFLPRAARMDVDEMLQMIGSFVQLGVRKLRLTGGEPLLFRDLLGLIERISSHWPELDLALTTNGSRLRALAEPLRGAGLRRITVSLDALDPQLFKTMSGGHGELAGVLDGIEQALACGFESVKLNCVVQRSQNLQQVLPLVRHFRHSGCVLRFIEYMDVGTINGWQTHDVVSAAELRGLIASEFAIHDHALPRLGQSEVAQRWALADGSLEIGFITSVSEPFCGDCSRARLSADGNLYTCLFSTQGHDLLSILRAQGAEVLSTVIQRIWSARSDRYSEQRGAASDGSAPAGTHSSKAEMFHLGG